MRRPTTACSIKWKRSGGFTRTSGPSEAIRRASPSGAVARERRPSIICRDAAGQGPLSARHRTERFWHGHSGAGTGRGRGIRHSTHAGSRGAGIAEMRALSPKQLADTLSTMPADAGAIRFGPIVDGLLLPDAKSVGANTNDTPILTGMTSHEMVGLNPNVGKATPETLRAQIDKEYGAIGR